MAHLAPTMPRAAWSRPSSAPSTMCSSSSSKCAVVTARAHDRQQEASTLEAPRAAASRRAALLLLPAAASLAATTAASLAAPRAAAAAAQLPMPGSQVLPEGTTRLQTTDETLDAMTPTDRQVYEINRRVQAQNRAPEGFPGFVRDGFDITIVADGYEVDSSGLVYRDFKVGEGDPPGDGQEVSFDYVGYNESGAAVDSSYRKGEPGRVRLGVGGLIPGFELGLRGMRVGGMRRIVVPPALGPPVGPSTFFSAKQCEVFDIELRGVKSCVRQQVAMFSTVVCE